MVEDSLIRDGVLGRCIITPDDYTAWLNQAEKGDAIRYFEGLLVAQATFKELGADARKLRDVVMHSCASGLVCLVQKRRALSGYDYIAIRTEKVT